MKLLGLCRKHFASHISHISLVLPALAVLINIASGATTSAAPAAPSGNDKREWTLDQCLVAYRDWAHDPDGLYGKSCYALTQSACNQSQGNAQACNINHDAWDLLKKDHASQQAGATDVSDPNCYQSFYAQLREIDTACEAANASAASSCNDNKDASTYGAPGVAGQVTQMAAMMSTAGAQGACSKMAEAASGLQAVMATFQVVCGGAIGDCEKACAGGKDRLDNIAQQAFNTCVRGSKNPNVASLDRDADKNMMAFDSTTNDYADMQNKRIRQCQAKNQVMANAVQNGAAAAATFAQTSVCAKQFAASSQSVCALNPGLPACSNNANLDCTKAPGNTSISCICKTNPNDPKCLGGTGAVAGSPTNSSSGAVPSNLGNQTQFGATPTAITAGDGITGFDPNAAGAGGGGGKNSGIATGSVGKAGGAGGLPSDPSGKGGGGGGGSQDPGAAIAYAKNGGSGGSFYGGGGGGTPTSSSLAGGPTYGKVNKVNLASFLPNQKFDPKRNIAGVVGPSGITCATCGSIFEKVSKRYFQERETLLQGN